jgi:hypothetical protein
MLTPAFVVLTLTAPSDPPTLADTLAPLSATFQERLSGCRADAHKQFERELDKLSKTAARVIAPAERDKQLSDLRPQVAEFARTGRVSAGLAGAIATGYLQDARLAAKTFADKAKLAAGGLKPADPRHREAAARGDDAYDAVNRLDLFQPGTAWDGVRRDKPQPATWWREVNPFKPTHSRYHIRRPQGGEAEWDVHVVSRTRNAVELKVAQGGGKAKWRMVGTFDGLRLTASNATLPNFGMLEGAARRAFRYDGHIVGEVGELAFDGFRADGKPTVGSVWFGRR